MSTLKVTGQTNESLLEQFKNNDKLKDQQIYNGMVGFRRNQKRDSVVYWFEVYENGNVFFNHSYNQNNGVTCTKATSKINGNFSANIICGYFDND